MSDQKIESPVTGELTGKQFAASFYSIFDIPSAPAGYFSVYRKMRTNPTIALARTIAFAPIKSSNYAIRADDDVDEGVKEFIEKQVDGFWPQLIENVLYSLDFGFQSFEKVWKISVFDGSLRYVYQKIKPLTPDNIMINVDQKYGTFRGIKQNEVTLGPEKCFHYIYDGEPGNYYGRSRHENIREHAWFPWIEMSKQELRYASKVAGVLPLVKYPVGESRDITGSEKSNFDIATAILDSLGRGKGIVMPQEIVSWAQDLARQGIDPEQFAAWKISFLEPKGTHGRSFIDMMRHRESLMLRGWIIPERAATEGQYGTKAEASTHGDLVLTMSDLVLQDILRNINWYLINPLLIYNFGINMENKVWMEKAGLDHSVLAFFRDLISKVLSAPSNIDLFQQWLDVDAMVEMAGLPKSKEVLNDLERMYNKLETEPIPKDDEK